MQRLSKDKIQESDLSLSSVSPDSWNKMRVTHAKAVCSKRALVDDIAYYSSVLEFNEGLVGLTLSDIEKDDGETLEIKWACYLKRRASEIVDVSLAVRSGIACLVYRAHICALFNEFFMNKKIKFTRLNISTLENRIRYVFQYFAKWYDCRKTRKVSVNKDIKKLWDKSVISSVTYYVMHLGAIGFLGYCKYMLEKNPDLD